MSKDQSPPPAATIIRLNTTRSCRQIHSDLLLQGGDQLEIVHRGEIYRLRVTRQGKLILTK